MNWSKYIYFLSRNIKNIALYFASLFEKTIVGDDQFDFKMPFKYLRLHIFFRYFLKTIFYSVKVKVTKIALNNLKKNLKKGQLIVLPTHHFIIEVYPVYELFSKAKQPFYLMVAREFFDLVLGLAAFPLKMAGCFSVSRGSKGAKQSLNFAKNIISQTNFPLVMFPEGESSLNIKSLLPVKKGAAILIQDALKLDKSIFIQPMTFKITYNDKIINDLNYIVDELEWHLNLPNKSLDYRERILYILDAVITRDLGDLLVKTDEPLLSKAYIYCETIKQYLNKKYNIDFKEERAYEVHIKKTKGVRNKSYDLNLVYKWIEVKGLIQYIPDPQEKNPAVWAGLVGKLLRMTYGDYGYESISRIMKHITVEPVIAPCIPVSFFKDKTTDEITEYLQDTLDSLNEKVNG
jgi:1-acyl-sn-glycerol-3-phosphate acyltransferase